MVSTGTIGETGDSGGQTVKEKSGIWLLQKKLVSGFDGADEIFFKCGADRYDVILFEGNIFVRIGLDGGSGNDK